MASSPQQGPAELRALVYKVANEIHDPCGLAYGHSIGLADMGLVRKLEVIPTDAGWNVELTLRLTAPNCLYYFYFERELKERLGHIAGVCAVDIRWDQVYDWTPDEVAPAARAKLAAARAAAIGEHKQRRQR